MTLLGAPFDLNAVLRLGGRPDGRPDHALARLPAAAPAEPLRGARHLDHRAAGLAVLRGRDPEPADRAVRRAGRATRGRSRRASGSPPAHEDELFAVGFTHRKAEYAVALARSDVDLDALALLPDDEVRATITAQRGLGPWTAEWFLARHLARPHAWPAGDLVLRKAALNLYGVDVHELGRAASPVPEPVGAVPPDGLARPVTIRRATEADEADPARAVGGVRARGARAGRRARDVGRRSGRTRSTTSAAAESSSPRTTRA